MEWMALMMFVVVALALLAGFPVAFTLAGTALLFAVLGDAMGWMQISMLWAMPNRMFGIMGNATLLAVPLFIFMGITLEKSRIAEDLLNAMARLLGNRAGGLAIAVAIVGMLLAASTGIVGATVVTMGLLSLPVMLKRGYQPDIACGTICASGTLGQIIPPSIVLVLLGDVLSAAYQQAQRTMGKYPPDSVSVGDLFVGALFPGLVLVVMYILYLGLKAWAKPDSMPAAGEQELSSSPVRWLSAFAAPVMLILLVLGSILGGYATPTEASAVGALGAMVLAAAKGQLSWRKTLEIARQTSLTTAMVFMILIGASVFSLVFRAYGGDEWIQEVLHGLPGGAWTALWLVLLVMFVLGFILDFIEITFVVVPLVAPALLASGFDPVWLGVMFALVLQTSFLTPPFGFSLFYLRGVAPKQVHTSDIYRGVLPFIVLQWVLIVGLMLWPGLATWLPHWVYG